MLLHFLGKIKNKTFLFAAAILCACLILSCADNIFEDFAVTNSFLAGNKFCAIFSAPVDPSSAKENFLFTEDDVQIDGETLFSENAMFFLPKKGILENHSYKAQIFSGVKDKRGNSLQRDYANTFHTKKDLSRPKVLLAKIEGGALAIEFSKAINQKSFLDNFSIEPQKEFFARWNESVSKVTLEFKEPLEERTLHSIKIQSGLLDALNNKMENDFYWSWTNEPDAPSLEFLVYGFRAGKEEKELLGDFFDQADFDKEFELLFNKEIDPDSAAPAIRAEENLSVETRTQGKSVFIKFKDKPKWNEAADLFVDAKICGKNGGRSKERKITIKNNAEQKRPPALEFIALKANDRILVIDKESAWTDISFDTEKYPEDQEKDFPLYFVYSISAAAQKIDRLSAMETTSVQTNSCAEIRLKSMRTESESEFSSCEELFESPDAQEKIFALKGQDKKLSLVLCGATFKNRQRNGAPARGVIEFKVGNKLRDDKNNFMEEAALFSCNKN